MASSPVTETATIDELRLGYTIVQQQQGEWIGEHVYYLEEEWEAATDERVLRFDTANLTVASDRIINPDDYRFQAPVLTPERADVPKAYQHRNTAGKFARLPAMAPRSYAGTYDLSRHNRLLKHVAEDDLVDIGISHRTLRYAAQTLYPGANVSVRREGGRNIQGRIKAVGFGIGGATLAFLLHSAEDRGSFAARSLASDFWINAQDVQIAVHDKLSPGRTLLNLHRLQHMTAFDNA